MRECESKSKTLVDSLVATAIYWISLGRRQGGSPKF